MMHIPLIAVIIAILACLYGAYSDLKEGIIPNKLTFPLIGLGLFLNALWAIIIGFYSLFIYALIFTAGIFILGYIFWRLGAWAGGDVKLFTALAALLPFPPLLISYSLGPFNFPLLAPYPFPLTIIVNSILSTLPFLLLFVFYIGLKEKPQVISDLLEPLKNYQENLSRAVIVTTAVTITWLIIPLIAFQWIFLSLVLILILVMIISKLPFLIKGVLVGVTLAYSLSMNWEVTLSGIVVLFIIITFIGLIKKLLTTVNQDALQDELKIENLEEGMIAAHNLYERDGEVYVDKESLLNKIKNSARRGDLLGLTRPKGKVLIRSLAAGLSEKDLKLLKKLKQEGKIGDTFRVKRGVPFAPAILIGLIISLFLGDLAYIILELIGTFI